MDRNLKVIITCTAIIVVVIPLTIILRPNQEADRDDITSSTPVIRQFWLFTSELNFNESKLGMPHDMFSIPTMIVNKGDTVVIHFFNTDQAGDSHSFTIGQPYNINVILQAGQNKTITFEAIKAGKFTYECTFHQPTMSGQLIVEN